EHIMPLGIFLSKWDPIKGLAMYAKAAVSGVDLTNDQLDKIFMSHASGTKTVEKLALQLDNLSIASRFFEKKTGNTLQRLLLTLVLNKGERAEAFYPQLDALENEIWESLPKQLKANMVLRDAFSKLTAQVISDIDAETIRKRVIKRAQDMLDGSQIDTAQRLLSYSKSIPDQLQANATTGLKLRNEKRYDESSKAYEEAKRCASILDEKELAEEFDRQSKRSAEIPILEKAREKAIKIAREVLKKEEFVDASSKFQEAADISDKLDDIVGKEINQKKADILKQYAEIDGLKG
nr:hypothetical protein [Candidatus Sigynarchaeota archaeon]